MDHNLNRKNLHCFFTKAQKQFNRDAQCYYPDKIGYNTELLNLCSEKEDLLEQALFEFFDDIKRSKFIIQFELNVLIENIVSKFISSIKYFTRKVMYLTWRPSEDMDIKRFKDIVINLLSKKIIDKYTIVYEQKGNSYNTIGKGKHIHALLKFKYDRSYVEYKKDIKKYFYVTHRQPKPSLKILDLDKNVYINSKIYYMGYLQENGELTVNENLTYKKGETVEATKEKLACLPYDRLFQRNNNLMDTIENILIS